MWAQGRELPELDMVCAVIIRLMTAQIERISSANASNGAKGGRGNKSEKSETKRKKPTVTVTVPVSDTITVSKTATAALLTDTQKTLLINEYGNAAFNAAYDRVNKNEPLNNCDSLDEPVPVADGENVSLLGAIEDDSAGEPFEEVEERDTYRVLHEAVAHLNERERIVIKARFFENESLVAVGEQLGVSRTTARNIEDIGLKALRRMKTMRELGNDFYRSSGQHSFRRNNASSVELIAEWREKLKLSAGTAASGEA
jgi:RNA polymerase sigma factor (sigma-70 family)